jgi:hypothetical protein
MLVPSKSTHKYLLICSEQSLDLGTVWETDALVCELPLANTGGEIVKIARFVNSCSCTDLQPRQLEIAPGATATVALTIDLRSAKAPSDPLATSEFSVFLQPCTANGEPLADWKLSARVRRAFALSEPVIELGELTERTPFVPVQITGRMAEGIERIEIVSENPAIQVTQQTSGDGTFTLRVQPTAELPRGFGTAKLRCTPIEVGGKRLVPTTVPVRWNVVPEIIVSVPQVLFGSMKRGERVEETLELSSRTKKPFRVERASTTMPGLGIVPVKEASPPTYRLMQAVEKLGQQSGVVTFQIRYGDGSTSHLDVPITYLGQER